ARRLREFREPGSARRLDVSFLVHRTARDHGPCAVPVPGQAKARQALRKYRSLERGFLPRRAAVDAHVYAPDATRAGPRDTAHLPEARTRKLRAERGPRDHRFHPHLEREL